jgi:hypothetical protein
MTAPGPAELFGRLRRNGLGDLGRRVVRRLGDRLGVDELDFPLLPGDVADSTRLAPPAAPALPPTGPLTIAWVCTPPSPGSGGHTTLFRMVQGMEERGNRCVLYLYDRHGGDVERHARVIRQFWPGMRAEVRDVADGMNGADAYVASSWPSAHVIAARVTSPAARLYFIQDFEPYFYAKGTQYALAEDSYRFGVRNIALGELVAAELEQLGVDYDLAPFGCDTEVYRLHDGSRPRSGVVYYTKPGSDRRGYLLGRLALEEFHRRHPEEPVHLYGDASDDWTIPTIQHHRMAPVALNELYNRTKAGLAISFTNITLVAEEMLAAGAIPVVTMAPFAKDVLPNPHVEWSLATPGAMADALSRVVEDASADLRRAQIADSVTQGWGATQEAVAASIVAAVQGAMTSSR